MIENTCLLSHTIAFMLSFAWEYIIPKSILKNEKKICEESKLKDVMPVIRDKIMELFSIKTIEIYTSIGGKLEGFFEEELMDRRGKKGVIKVSGREQTDFLSPELMYCNYKKLDTFYEKSMGP